MIYEFVKQMQKELGQLNKWLDTATSHATDKKFDVNVLVTSRLAPDQFPLSRQIQSTCDTVKFALARVGGKEMPQIPDEEKTIADLKARVSKTIALVDGVSAKDFEGAADRVVVNPRWEGKVMNAKDYFLEHVTPNFYFHLAHTYAILRHNGVNIGKKDYLGQLSLKDPK
ncbi:MAG: DUF1993 domain-containing protein [Polyangiaceae bacterium]